MTARDEILAAIGRIERRSGHDVFTVVEVLDELRRSGSAYMESTVRTHIVSRMCANAPDHHAVVYRDLERLERGHYRLRRSGAAPAPPPPPPPPAESAPGRITEDDVKRAVAAHLEAEGYIVEVKWGAARGIDIDARRGGERLIVEAKAEVAKQPQQVNYFLNALGELTQRMADPTARYGLALPDNPQYRGLVRRLPAHARGLLGLLVFFVRRQGDGFTVEVEQPGSNL